MATVFDTLIYARKLEASGFTRQQAEAQAEALAEVVEVRLATKQDVLAVKQDVLSVKYSLEQTMQLLKRDLKLWFGSMLGSAVALLTALITFTHIH